MPSPRPISLRLLILSLCASLAGCDDDAPANPLERLAELHDLRSIGPRVSIETRHRSCAGAAASDGAAPIACASSIPPSSSDLLELASAISRQVSSRAEPEALHAAGLIDLLWGGRSGNSVDRAISYLAAAARLGDRPADALSDLSAAYLVRAEESGSPRDLLQAVDAAARAQEREPNHAGAMYNLALAMDLLTADVGAATAWRRYEEMSGDPGWDAEARARVAALEVLEELPTPPALGAAAADVRGYARATPEQARLLGWDVLLGDWGDALIRGDTANAAASLRLARLFGAELASAGGDASLADAVLEIDRASGDPAARREMARAHRAYAVARADLLAGRLAVAQDSFASVLRDPRISDALQHWAEIYQAATIVLDGRLQEGWTRLSRVLERVDPVRHPAVAGQALEAMSTARIRDGRYEEAIEHARSAATHYAGAREHESHGSQLYLQADAELAIGAVEAGYRSMYDALVVLRPYRSSVWRYNGLTQLGSAAADEGLFGPASFLTTEAVAAADLSRSAVHQVEGRVGRARVLAAVGDTAAARADLLRSRDLLGGVESTSSREWLLVDLRLAESALAAEAEPRRAIAALDSILAAPAGIGTQSRLLAALVARAAARLNIGETAAAAADLERAADVVSEASKFISRSSLRAALLDDARAVFDRLVLLEAGRGEPLRALEHLERGRLSLAPGARLTGHVGPLSPRIAEGEAALSYLIAGDTILTWIVQSRNVQLVRTVVNGEALGSTIDRARASLELAAGEETLQDDLARLHDWLFAPVRDRIGSGISRLVVVADGKIAGVPFAALLDRDRDRHLVESYQLRFASSLRDVAPRSATARAPSAHGAAAVFVGDPGAGAETRGFAPLPGSIAEVRTLSAYYENARLISGDSVTRSTITRALRGSAIFHFAGHAVFDDARPELSFLVLAPDREGEPERLSAATLHDLDLHGVRLVVLAACETLRSGGGRSGGFAGFAGFLLQSGVDGVVGSLWRVDDHATTPLMLAFHESFAASGDGPASLREAQLRLLRSSDQSLSAPSAWAGFQYAGN